MDLFDSAGLKEVSVAHAELVKTLKKAGAAPPKNVGPTPDKAGRLLDCAALNYPQINTGRSEMWIAIRIRIRAPFGEPIYRGQDLLTTRIQRYVFATSAASRAISGRSPARNG